VLRKLFQNLIKSDSTTQNSLVTEINFDRKRRIRRTVQLELTRLTNQEDIE
jgi:hypothetical protein